MHVRRSWWSRLSIAIHVLVVMVASWQLAQPHVKLVYMLWGTLSGVSLFVLTGLVHEASHYLLFRSTWLNEGAGNLAGWLVLTPLSAYRAFHLKHHQTTNADDDPNTPLNSRWMLGFGSLVSSRWFTGTRGVTCGESASYGTCASWREWRYFGVDLSSCPEHCENGHGGCPLRSSLRYRISAS